MPVQLSPFYTYRTGYPRKTIVRDGDTFERMIRFLTGRTLYWDFETSGLDYFKQARACGLALAAHDDQGALHCFYTPFRHQSGEAQLDIAQIGPAFGRLLADERTLKGGHNVKFDDHFARKEGWRVLGPRYDTMIAARLYDENRPMALKYRAKTDLGIANAEEFERKLEEEVRRLARANGMGVKEYKNRYGYSQVNQTLCGTYACFDVDYTGGLHGLYERGGLAQQYGRIWPTEMELTEVLCSMEEAGLLIDREYLISLRTQLGDRCEQLEREIRHVTGGAKFNIASDDELREFLQRGLGLHLTKLTEKKQLAVDREVLEGFEGSHASVGLILNWREAYKLFSTYTQSLLDRMDDQGYIHPEYQQVGTDTGRTACKYPNFQNISSDSDARALKHTGKRLEDGGTDPWSIRRAFLNRGPGWVRLYFDYSQAELRVLAHYSQDPVMVSAYLTGEDIHSRTSMEVFGTAEKSRRRMAKIINFGLAYGLGSTGFSRQAHIPKEEAEAHFRKFFERYSGITAFRDRFWSDVRRRNGQFLNLWGRPRRVWGINSADKYERGKAERQAIATLIQGTAAELTKESLVRLSRWIRARGLEAHLVATIHDEIQIDCRVDDMPEVARATKAMMEHFPEFAPIPIVVDAAWTTTNWAEKKGIK